MTKKARKQKQQKWNILKLMATISTPNREHNLHIAVLRWLLLISVV